MTTFLHQIISASDEVVLLDRFNLLAINLAENSVSKNGCIWV